MEAVAFAAAYLILSACVLWRKEILAGIRTLRNEAQKD